MTRNSDATDTQLSLWDLLNRRACRMVGWPAMLPTFCRKCDMFHAWDSDGELVRPASNRQA